jgi:hypothetical protein
MEQTRDDSDHTLEKKQAWTCRAHRIYPQRYKLRENRNFKENPLPWGEGPLTDAEVPRVNTGIKVEGNGKRLVFDFSQDVWIDDALAVLRDLLRIQYEYDVKNRPDRREALDQCKFALFSLQSAIENMDKRALAIHGYSNDPVEASMKPNYEHAEGMLFG